MEESFAIYKKSMQNAFRILSERHPSQALDDQAIPAYIKGFFLSRWVFWSRITFFAKFLTHSHCQGELCLDFGCGTGILLPLLFPNYKHVIGVDPEVHLTRECIALYDKQICEKQDKLMLFEELKDADLAPQSLDLIVAFDVLEHIENSDSTLNQLSSFLTPNGSLLISGPTENKIYKLGRKLVGFSGQYHKRSIYDIEQSARSLFKVRTVKRILFPFTLFKILLATNKKHTSKNMVASRQGR